MVCFVDNVAYWTNDPLATDDEIGIVDPNEIRTYIEALYTDQSLNWPGNVRFVSCLGAGFDTSGPACTMVWPIATDDPDHQVPGDYPQDELTELRDKINWFYDMGCCTTVCSQHFSGHDATHYALVLDSHDITHDQGDRSIHYDINYADHDGDHLIGVLSVNDTGHLVNDYSGDLTGENTDYNSGVRGSHRLVDRTGHYITHDYEHHNSVLDGDDGTFYSTHLSPERVPHNASERAIHFTTAKDPDYTGHRYDHFTDDNDTHLVNAYPDANTLARATHLTDDRSPYDSGDQSTYDSGYCAADYTTHDYDHHGTHYDIANSPEDSGDNNTHYQTNYTSERGANESGDEGVYNVGHDYDHHGTHYDLDNFPEDSAQRNTHFNDYDNGVDPAYNSSDEASYHESHYYNEHTGYDGGDDGGDRGHNSGHESTHKSTHKATHKATHKSTHKATHKSSHQGSDLGSDLGGVESYFDSPLSDFNFSYTSGEDN